ncbi:hypothetical protein RCL_jg15750.t1 [Rhizophagus clarus]|uniref:Uncharacterized protein n=1 Tax=Rhizophagus clarus TaxID=94130 RepID=A0A8H3M7I7_9GLOM|nr:hypothetical protein RCL_jg15750.t1 [Rhizophagus clarus]
MCDIKCPRTGRSSANLPAKKLRKIKMTEILLNCLVISNNLIGKSTVQDIVAVEIDSKRSIHFLREAIRKAYAPPV